MFVMSNKLPKDKLHCRFTASELAHALSPDNSRLLFSKAFLFLMSKAAYKVFPTLSKNILNLSETILAHGT